MLSCHTLEASFRQNSAGNRLCARTACEAAGCHQRGRGHCIQRDPGLGFCPHQAQRLLSGTECGGRPGWATCSGVAGRAPRTPWGLVTSCGPLLLPHPQPGTPHAVWLLRGGWGHCRAAGVTAGHLPGVGWLPGSGGSVGPWRVPEFERGS